MDPWSGPRAHGHSELYAGFTMTVYVRIHSALVICVEFERAVNRETKKTQLLASS